MKNIRTGVFETNSSSTHSVSICRATDGIYDTLPVDDAGVLTLTGGQFGWEEETYYDAQTKANYAAVFCSPEVEPAFVAKAERMRELLVNVLKQHTGAREIVFNFSLEDYNHPHHSYIDHQSAIIEGGDAGAVFESEDVLKDFIFNTRSSLTTDNDNH